MDPHNFLTPRTGSANRAIYESSRPTVKLADNATTVINTNWQLHPAMYNATAASNFMGIVTAGKAAVLMNVGPLTRPTARNNYYSGTLPRQLFSHSDQSAEWQTGDPLTPNLKTGFLGRLTDMLHPSFNASSTVGSLYTFVGKGAFSGTYDQKVSALAPSGIDLRASGTALNIANKIALDPIRYPDPATLSPLQAQVSQSHLDADTFVGAVKSVLDAATITGPTFVDDAASNSTLAALKLIKSMGSLNQRRQIHWISQGGFDQHDGLLSTLNANLAGDGNAGSFRRGGVARYIKQVYDAITDASWPSDTKVTMLVYTEFGRTLTQNTDGTDHAWGGHAVLVGNDVLGTSGLGGSCLFGAEPDFSGFTNTTATSGNYWVPISPGTTTTSDARGLMIPTTPNDSLYMTISKWMGVPDTTIATYNPMNLVVPNYVAGGFTDAGVTARNLGMLA
jgi:uncharacterized protein (DUF1501 family)